MPQLDILSYFPQFIFLLISFLSTYYFVVTFILPNNVSAGKLRAKFTSQLQDSAAFGSKAQTSYQTQTQTVTLDSLTLEALKSLAEKSAALATLEELNIANKNNKYTVQPPLIRHYTTVLANKKRQIKDDIIQV